MAMDMFIKIGAPEKGESRDKTHARRNRRARLELGHVQQRLRPHGRRRGRRQGERAGPVDHQVHRPVLAGPDAGLPEGQALRPPATLVVRKAGETPLEYVIITMTEVMITSVRPPAVRAAEDRLTENVSLNFAKVKREVRRADGEGRAGAKPEMTYNIAENTKE